MDSLDTFPQPAHPFPKRGEPAWDLALMYPLQGAWSVDEYLALDSGLLVEYTAGFVRVLPMPTMLHQLLVQFLFRALDDIVSRGKLGRVFVAPLPVKLGPDKYREPDIVFLRPERISSVQGHPQGADLVMEVVSDDTDSRERDYVEKRREYAEAGIGEYWIVDPQETRIVVLTLVGDTYCERGVYGSDTTAESVVIPGLRIHVNDLFTAGRP
jgi:Uma2 family endonuclease